MKALLTFPLALALGSCSVEDHVGVHQYSIYFGTVKDTNTGATLSTFCTNPTVERSRAIVFSAAPGAFVEEEVLFESREEKLAGSIPPERDEAFWCSAAPETYLRNNEYWICLQSIRQQSSGDHLGRRAPRSARRKGFEQRLRAQTAGSAFRVLHVAFSAQCLEAHSDSYTGGVPVPWGELTIQ